MFLKTTTYHHTCIECLFRIIILISTQLYGIRFFLYLWNNSKICTKLEDRLLVIKNFPLCLLLVLRYSEKAIHSDTLQNFYKNVRQYLQYISMHISLHQFCIKIATYLNLLYIYIGFHVSKFNRRMIGGGSRILNHSTSNN